MLDLGRDKTYRLLRAARAYERSPIVREAFERGEISYGKVDEIARLSRGDDIERWLDLAREKPRDVLREGIDRDERFLPPDGPNRITRFEVEADHGIIKISGKAPDGTLIVERPRECRDRALV